MKYERKWGLREIRRSLATWSEKVRIHGTKDTLKRVLCPSTMVQRYGWPWQAYSPVSILRSLDHWWYCSLSFSETEWRIRFCSKLHSNLLTTSCTCGVHRAEEEKLAKGTTGGVNIDKRYLDLAFVKTHLPARGESSGGCSYWKWHLTLMKWVLLACAPWQMELYFLMRKEESLGFSGGEKHAWVGVYIQTVTVKKGLLCFFFNFILFLQCICKRSWKINSQKSAPVVP